MNDSVLVEALRARDPGALADLYDSYAESIYSYAWALLHSSDGAQVALRDTLIAAEAHVHALADPERLRVWLYALARGESLRRRSTLPGPPSGGGLPDPPPGGDEQTVPGAATAHEAPDGDLRLVAANAAAGLADDEREVLELITRLGVPEDELAAVLGMPAAHADQLRGQACVRLQDLVTAEILARGRSRDCAVREDILAGFTGTLDEETRERLLQHAEECAVCVAYRERQVSAAKVFDLLPPPALPETLRVRVMSCFIDPELVPYRRFVARRTGLLDPDGFPARDAKGVRRWPAIVAGAVAAVAVVTVALVLFDAVRGAQDQLSRAAAGVLPAPPGSTGGQTPAPSAPARTTPVLTPGAGGRLPHPGGSRRAVLPIAVIVPHPGASGPSALVPTPSPSLPAPKPTPPPAPSARPSEVVPPPPVTQPGPPREQPSAEPSPTVSHQNNPVPTPCPSTDTPAPAPSSPPKTGVPSLTPMPSAVRSPVRRADPDRHEPHREREPGGPEPGRPPEPAPSTPAPDLADYGK